MRVTINTDDWQRLGRLGRVLGNELQEQDECKQNRDRQRYFLYNKRHVNIDRKSRRQTKTVKLPPESGGSQKTNKAIRFVLF